MVTLKDVALRAGVSIASVSTVVNGTATVSVAMRERVQQAVAELGYVPHALARNLKLGRTSTVGLVLPDITNPHFSGLASAIEEACDEAGFTLTLCSTTDDASKEIRQLEVLRRQRAAGVIFIPGGSRTRADDALVGLLSGPVVCLDRVVPGLDLDAVILDNVEAGRAAAEHLLKRGHRRLAIVAGDEALGISRDRVQGFLGAIDRFGVCRQDVRVRDGGFQIEPSFEAALALFDNDDPPTGIVAANNHATVGVMKALAARTMRCPDDVSIVGIDDFAWADAFLPRLTAVSQPIAEMGRAAVRLLLQQTRSRATARERVVLQPRVIERSSTQPLRANQSTARNRRRT